ESKTAEIAKNGLIEKFDLSEKQAQAILDMRLQRLTGLEREKIEEEYNELLELIKELKAILADDEKVLQIIRDELIQMKEKFNDESPPGNAIGGSEFVEDADLMP